MLERIESHGTTEVALLNLKGRAKQYTRSYVRSLQSAIKAHNEGLATNSPLSPNTLIEEGPFGPRGGRGYRLVPRDPLIAVAEEAKEALEKGERI